VGPTETQSGIDTGASSSGAKNLYLYDNVFLPTGSVTGIQVSVDTNVIWSPFDLQIYRAIGDPTTAENFTLIGKYEIGTQLSATLSTVSNNFLFKV